MVEGELGALMRHRDWSQTPIGDRGPVAPEPAQRTSDESGQGTLANASCQSESGLED